MTTNTIKPSQIGLTYGLGVGLIMIIVFLLHQFIPLITPSWLSIINLVVLAAGLIIVPLNFKKHNAGFMTFAQGLGSNSIVILISSLVSALFVYLYVKFIDDFYLLAIKEARLDALRGKVSEEQAIQLIERSGGLFSAEFIMIPLLISKFLIGFALTFIIVGVLVKREPEYMDR